MLASKANTGEGVQVFMGSSAIFRDLEMVGLVVFNALGGGSWRIQPKPLPWRAGKGGTGANLAAFGADVFGDSGRDYLASLY